MLIDHLLGEPTRLLLVLHPVSQLHIAPAHHRREIEMITVTEPRLPNGPMLRWQKLHRLATVIVIPDRHQVALRIEALMFAMHHLRPLQQPQFPCQPTTVQTAPLSSLHLPVHAVDHLSLTVVRETTLTVVHLLTVAAVRLRRHRIMVPQHAINMIPGRHHHQITLPTALVLHIMALQPLTKLPIARRRHFAPITAALQRIHVRSASIILLLRQLSKKVVKRYRV